MKKKNITLTKLIPCKEKTYGTKRKKKRKKKDITKYRYIKEVKLT